LTVIIDNNFLFSQINGAIKNKSKIEDTFIYKLTSSSIVNLIAPFKIREEINDKIALKIKSNKRIASQYANSILSKITLIDAPWIDEWKKASNLIGDIDSDDVPYLALAFHSKSHSIISNDEVFKKQGDLKAWTVADTKNVMSTYQSGFISFCIYGSGILIVKSFLEILFIILQSIGQVIIELLSALGSLIGAGFDLISRIPNEIFIALIIIYFGGLIFSEEFRDINIKAFDNITDFVTKTLIKFGTFLNETINDFVSFLKEHKEIGIAILEFLAFLSLEFKMMEDQIEKLEKERVK
jgi:predicted nucleic acid-binding protein